MGQPHHLVDWQEIVALSIVAVAAWIVLRRLLDQVRAFGKPKLRKRAATAKPAAAPPPQLVQIQLRPPAHLKRPPSDTP